MGSHVSKLDSELKKVESEIKKLSAQLKKGSNPAVVKQIRELMIKYSKTNVENAYTAAAKKDSDYFSKALSDSFPGVRA